MTIGGQNLEGVTNAHVSGPGVRAAVLEHVKPLTTQQFNTFREKLKELQEKRDCRPQNRQTGRNCGPAPMSSRPRTRKRLPKSG